MSNSDIYSTLAAMLPRVSRQPGGKLPSLPEVYALATTMPAPAGEGPGGSTASDVLQATLKQASDTISQSNRQLTDLQALQQQLLETLGQNTQAVSSNTQTKASAASDALQTAGGALGGIVAGSILTPIVSGLMSLFGNGGSTTAPVLPGFTLPAPVQIQTVVNGGPGAQPALIQPAAAASAPQTARGGEAQVQVQVNAMDARSFLDHSDEIADAVRRALLSSHALGDVIAEL